MLGGLADGVAGGLIRVAEVGPGGCWAGCFNEGLRVGVRGRRWGRRLGAGAGSVLQLERGRLRRAGGLRPYAWPAAVERLLSRMGLAVCWVGPFR